MTPIRLGNASFSVRQRQDDPPLRSRCFHLISRPRLSMFGWLMRCGAALPSRRYGAVAASAVRVDLLDAIPALSPLRLEL
jgi:hypothetical protein